MKNKAIEISIFFKFIIEKILLKWVKYASNVKRNFFSQSVNIPMATYAPWNDDFKFLKTYEKIKNKTTIDIYRLYEIWEILENLKGMEGNIVEVGVYKGGSAALIGLKIKNEKSKILLFDTFEGVALASKEDNKYKGGEFADTTIESVTNFINKLNIKNYEITKCTFPKNLNQKYNFGKIKLIHIDVDTYQSAKHCFDFLWPKLSRGGCIIFDDYGFVGCEGVTKFVNQIKKRMNKDNFRFLHNLNGHGIFFKK
jgi:O-methyltransferase